MSKGTPGVRYAEVDRETRETRVRVALDLDAAQGRPVRLENFNTGIGFFDHMLHQMGFHGRFELGIVCEGDLSVDDHHTVEDVGIALGTAIRDALADSSATERYASCHTPMDDALVLIAIDISGRGHLTFDVPFNRPTIGTMSTENVAEFFRAVVTKAGITMHVRKECGDNDHHVCEALFKGFGRALYQATRMVERRGVSSTKGVI